MTCLSSLRSVAPVFVFSLVATVFLGCSVKRSAYDVPDIPLPAQYRNSPPENTSSPTPLIEESSAKSPTSQVSQSPEMVEWWRYFGSAELAALIDRGVANNPDVRIATLKIAQIKARADQVRADQAPSITASVGSSAQAPGGQVGSVPVGVEDNKTVQKLYQASIRGNWRLDLWGEQSALAESAGLQVWQAVFERDNVQRGMVANLASSYVEYLSLNDRLRIAQDAERVLSGILTTIERRVKAGDATLIELEQQKAAIYSVRATIPNLEQQREDAIASIAFLVGTVPGALSLSESGLDALRLPRAVPALPSSLILRRPDVRILEAKLLAADADVDVARARILPPLDLSTQVGYSSLAMSRLFQPVSLFWNAIANLTVSIFDSGKLSSQKEQAKTAHEEMVETYARVIYQAVREVESALAGIRLTEKRFDAQQEATAAAQRAWDSSNEVYAVGGLDHLTLLDAGRTYLRYLDDYQRIRMDRYRGFIALFQALGGGADFGELIPGKGVRPTPIRSRFAGNGPVVEEKVTVASEGVEWAAGQLVSDGGALRVENFWQVELPGLYHRSAIGPTWRDLRTRFPKLMEGRIVRPRLSGRIEDSADGQASWYRLYVAKYTTPVAAEAFCAALKATYQRCRVVSSTSDDTVVPTVVTQKEVGVTSAGGAEDKPKADAAPPIDQVDTRSKVQEGEVKDATAEPVGNVVRSELSRERQVYTVQLGAFSNLENAAIAYAYWRFKEYDAFVSEFRDAEGRSWYAVRSGVFPLRRDASLTAASLRRKESASAVVVPILLDKSGKPSVVALDDLKLPVSTYVPPVVPEPPEAPVAVAEALKPASPEKRENFAYSVQLGAFSSIENAAVALSFWQNKGYGVFAAEIRDGEGRIWFTVRSGAHAQRSDATASALLFGRTEDVPAVVVRTEVDESGRPRGIDIAALHKGSAAERSLERQTVKRVSPVNASFAPRTIFHGRAYSVQLGAFSNPGNAAKSLAEWQAKGHEAYVCEIPGAEKRVRYAVRAGVFSQRRDAAALVRTLARREGTSAMLVPAVLDRFGRLAVLDTSMLDQLHNNDD